MSSPDHRSVRRILFSSPCGPYPKTSVEKDPVDFFYYRNTLGQGVFRLRSFQSWYSLHYLAQNLPVESVVLENPSMKQFQEEVWRGDFQAVAIGFTVITTARVLEMVRWLKETRPQVEIILGGYGTAVFKDPDESAALLASLVTTICYGEGVEFMRRYLRERSGDEMSDESRQPARRQDFLPMEHAFFRSEIPLFKQLVFLGSLGCTFGCSFCATSSQFDRKRVQVLSGNDLFDLILEQAHKHPEVESAIIYDEDFLIDKRRVREFMARMDSCHELQERPLLLTVFASLRSVAQYSMEELIRCGIGTIYIGVESFVEETLDREGLGKRHGDVKGWFEKLHRHGINTLGSLIIGWDGHTSERVVEESERFVSLNPTFYQIVPLHPVPGTALWKRLKEEGRLLSGYTFENDSIGKFNFWLKDVTSDDALDSVGRTYTGLVAEGGPWPFRLSENLLRGYQHLRSHDHPVLRMRAHTYLKMFRRIFPLAIVSRMFFHGSGFIGRWSRLMRRTGQENRVLLLTSILLALLLCPVIVGSYGLANFLHWIRPLGDQPRYIRVAYSGDPVRAPS